MALSSSLAPSGNATASIDGLGGLRLVAVRTVRSGSLLARLTGLTGLSVLVQGPTRPHKCGNQSKHNHKRGCYDGGNQFAMRRGILRIRHACHSFTAIRRATIPSKSWNPVPETFSAQCLCNEYATRERLVPKPPYCRRYGKDVLAIPLFRMRLERPEVARPLPRMRSMGHH